MTNINKTSRKEWNQFVIQNYGSFLQSFEWGQFQESLGRKVFRLAIPHNAQALVVKYNLPLGKSYLYCPHGPVTASGKWSILRSSATAEDGQVASSKLLLEKIQRIAEQENAVFWRMDPIMPDSAEERAIFKKLGLQKLSWEIQPKKTLILDLTNSEKELLSQMHQKTRYNVRLAEKKDVKVAIEPLSHQAANVFCELIQKTAKRDGFRSHPREYYQKMLEAFPLAKLFTANYKGKVIAANIVVFFGKRATYLHGASDYKYRNLMAPHLLQWHQIKEAKKRGLGEYDFWGIDEKNWPGVTRFKKGFGGKEVTYIGAWDLVYYPGWYKVYNLARKVL